MVKEFSSIVELKSIREQKSRLSERESELAQPMLTDLSMIPRIYEWFKELSDEDKKGRKMAVLQRKKFMFIILFLYSPATLAGDKMKVGLRDKLCEVLGLPVKSTLSKNLVNLTFHYRMYKYFRRDIERIYTALMERMKGEGFTFARW